MSAAEKAKSRQLIANSSLRLTCPSVFGIKASRKAHARRDAPRPRARRLLSMAKRAQRYLSRLGLHLERAKQRIRRSGFSNFDEERLLEGFISDLLPEGHERTAVDIGAGDGVR